MCLINDEQISFSFAYFSTSIHRVFSLFFFQNCKDCLLHTSTFQTVMQLCTLFKKLLNAMQLSLFKNVFISGFQGTAIYQSLSYMLIIWWKVNFNALLLCKRKKCWILTFDLSLPTFLQNCRNVPIHTTHWSFQLNWTLLIIIRGVNYWLMKAYFFSLHNGMSGPQNTFKMTYK